MSVQKIVLDSLEKLLLDSSIGTAAKIIRIAANEDLATTQTKRGVSHLLYF